MNMSAVAAITNAHAVIKRYPDALKALLEADPAVLWVPALTRAGRRYMQATFRSEYRG